MLNAVPISTNPGSILAAWQWCLSHRAGADGGRARTCSFTGPLWGLGWPAGCSRGGTLRNQASGVLGTWQRKWGEGWSYWALGSSYQCLFTKGATEYHVALAHLLVHGSESPAMPHLPGLGTMATLHVLADPDNCVSRGFPSKL